MNFLRGKIIFSNYNKLIKNKNNSSKETLLTSQVKINPFNHYKKDNLFD